MTAEEWQKALRTLMRFAGMCKNQGGEMEEALDYLSDNPDEYNLIRARMRIRKAKQLMCRFEVQPRNASILAMEYYVEMLKRSYFEINDEERDDVLFFLRRCDDEEKRSYEVADQKVILFKSEKITIGEIKENARHSQYREMTVDEFLSLLCSGLFYEELCKRIGDGVAYVMPAIVGASDNQHCIIDFSHDKPRISIKNDIVIKDTMKMPHLWKAYVQ